MTPMQIAFLAIVFLAVFGVALVALHIMAPGPVSSRLDAITGTGRMAPGQQKTGWTECIVRLTGPLAKLSVPDEGWEDSLLRIRFTNAGFRDALAPAIFFAMETLLAIACQEIAGAGAVDQ